MYYINKIVGWSLSPLGIFFLGLFVGWLCRRWKSGRVCGNRVMAFAVLQLWVMSCGIATRWVGLPLEVAETDVAGLPSADAIVLLGGGMGHHEQCGRPEIFQAGDRVWMAAKLWKLGKAPFLTVSGGGAKGEIAFLRDMGVDTNKIVVLESARNTAEEAALIAGAIREGGGMCTGECGKAKILLVTSAWHMPRAKMLFERAGFEVVAAATDYEMHFVAESPVGIGDFFPNCDALMRNSCAVKEWVARLCYAVMKG